MPPLTPAFDYDGQMTGSTVGGVTTSFGYDASGRRTTRTAGGTTTRFYCDGSNILAEKQGSTTTAVYTYGEGLIRKDSEVPLFDGQGTERTVTNGSQTVVGTLNLDGFGNQVGSTGSSSSPYMYAATSGYRNDNDAGLTHVGARYYDAQVGRFITRDTYLDQKPYLYCEHDPVNGLDPSGHEYGYNPIEIQAAHRQVDELVRRTPLPVRGAIVGTVIVIGGSLLLPEVAATAVGSFIIGGVAGGVGAAVGGGGTTEIIIGVIGGGIGGVWSGVSPAPWWKLP